MKLSTNGRNAGINAITALANAGSTNTAGALLIYQGTQPADPQTAATGSTLLVTIPLANPAFGAAVTGTAAIPGAVSATVATTGTAQWARMVDRSGSTAVADFSVGTSGADINFDNTSFVAGGTAAIASFSLTQPQ